jgi:hypothetical protein
MNYHLRVPPSSFQGKGIMITVHDYFHIDGGRGGSKETSPLLFTIQTPRKELHCRTGSTRWGRERILSTEKTEIPRVESKSGFPLLFQKDEISKEEDVF